MHQLPLADPEIAAATLEHHLDEYWGSGRPAQLGMERQRLDPLRWIVTIPATRPDGQTDPYHLKIDGRHYDLHPVDAHLVVPPHDGDDRSPWPEAQPGTRWWPRFQEEPPALRLHPHYRYSDGTTGQLICFSFTAAYYVTNHNPTPDARWQQGRHTVAATIARLHEALKQPYYLEPDRP